MFSNIGEKCKGLAVFSAIAGIVSSVIIGIVYMAQDQILLGSVILVLGSLFAWIGSWALYCIGDTNCVVNSLNLPNNGSSDTFVIPQKVDQNSGKTNASSPWKCYCGYSVPQHMNECPECGRTKAESDQAKKTAAQVTKSTTWKCPKCGRENQGYVSTCPCGQSKPQ